MESLHPHAHVLIVDDDEKFCMVLSDLLALKNLSVHYVLSAEEAFRHLQTEKVIDLILLDLNLGSGLSGLEALALFKKQFPFVQIIMLTSDASLTSGLECLKKGAYDYLSKPFNEERFWEILPGVLEKKKLLQLNDLYLQIMVHDLRSPLNNIAMLTATLAKTTGTKLSSQEKEFLSLLELRVWQMSNMLENILRVNQLESQTLTARSEEFVLEEATHEQLDIIFNNIKLCGQQYELVFPTPPGYRLKTDKELFFRILQNLVSNALRFTPSGKTISILMEVLNAPQAGVLKVSVTNPGKTLDEKNSSQVFNKFYKAKHWQEGGRANFGLGLTFCELAVKILGGQIGVACDELLPATTFYFTIPNPKRTPI